MGSSHCCLALPLVMGPLGHCQILFDQVRLSRGISKNGVSVSVTGATMSVNIPAIGVSVTFDGRIFQVRLSYSQFNHNTEGQCGEWVQPGSWPHSLSPTSSGYTPLP
jgi:hypothetical protein